MWQSVNDILLTPVGSRLMRRNYGSLCPDLIDSPQNDVTRLQLMSAAVIALAAWEPRIVLETITVTYSASGAVTAALSGMLTETMEKHPRGDIKGRQCQRLTSHSYRNRPLSKNSTSRRSVDVKALMVAVFPADQQSAVAAALGLESEPLNIIAGRWRTSELLLRQRINEAVAACMLSHSTGDDLDNITASTRTQAPHHCVGDRHYRRSDGKRRSITPACAGGL